MKNEQRLKIVKDAIESLDYQVDGRIPMTNDCHEAIDLLRNIVSHLAEILESQPPATGKE